MNWRSSPIGLVPSQRSGYRARHVKAAVTLRLPQGESASAASALPQLVVVPVGRSLRLPLPGVRLAVDLVSASPSALLLVICSNEASAGDFPDELRHRIPAERLICIDLAEIDRSWLPQLPSQSVPVNKLHRQNDVSEKRNLALALAAAMGCTSMLYLDDDVFSNPEPSAAEPTLTVGSLAAATTELARNPGLRIIGWRSRDFDDNSVAGHIRTFCGWAQGVFPGSGAMLVRCDRKLSFFPAMYNEDWLFMIAAALKTERPRRAIGLAGSVRQQVYDPFDHRRAMSEEVGDLIAEELMNFLEDGRDVLRLADKSSWQQVIASRWDMLKRLKMAAKHPGLGQPAKRRAAVVKALNGALDVHTRIDAEQLAQFIASWWADQETWDEHVSQLRTIFATDRSLALKLFAQGDRPMLSAGRPELSPAAAVPQGELASYV